MFCKDRLDNVIVIGGKDTTNDKIHPGIKYHIEKFELLYQNNILIVDDGKINFSFVSSMPTKNYKEAISAHTFLNLLGGCINNEFSKDLKSGDSEILLEKDYSHPEHPFMKVNIILNGNDVDLFITRIAFLSNTFLVVKEDYNKVLEYSATNAKIIRTVEPKINE